jgi:thiamine biosynthesis lipoprotein
MGALGFRGRAAWRDSFEACGGPPFELDPRTRSVRAARAGAVLDLGGVAKGFALDLAARELRAAGVGSALLHGGTSSVAAIGAPPGEEAWWVALAAPAGAEPGPAVALCDASLSVSASAGRAARDAAGRRIGHVLDPRTGRAAPLGALAAVVAPSGLRAEAWSTALVAGTAAGENPRPMPLPDDCAAVLARRASSGEVRWTFHGDHARCFKARSTTTP